MDMSFTTPPATVSRFLEMQGRILVVCLWWVALVFGGMLVAKHLGPVWGASVGYYAALAVMMDYAAPKGVGLWS